MITMMKMPDASTTRQFYSTASNCHLPLTRPGPEDAPEPTIYRATMWNCDPANELEKLSEKQYLINNDPSHIKA